MLFKNSCVSQWASRKRFYGKYKNLILTIFICSQPAFHQSSSSACKVPPNHCSCLKKISRFCRHFLWPLRVQAAILSMSSGIREMCRGYFVNIDYITILSGRPGVDFTHRANNAAYCFNATVSALSVHGGKLDTACNTGRITRNHV